MRKQNRVQQQQRLSEAGNSKPLPQKSHLRQEGKEVRNKECSGSIAKALRQENARDGKAVVSTRKAAAG